MGGAPATRIPLKLWRDCEVSADLIDPLEDLAASVRPLVSPIIGFGSYRTNTASGGTDAGSGHVDCYATGTGWTDDERRRFVENGRQRGLMVFERTPRWWSPKRQRWLTESWAHHFHIIRKDSADLSPAARAQLDQWFMGSNGLAGFYIGNVFTYDPDPSSRTYLRQTWPQYRAIKGDDMPTPKDLWDYPMPSPVDGTNYTAQSWLTNANVKAGKALSAAADALAQVAALTAAFQALQAHPDLTAAQITEAAKAGAAAALQAKITADVTVNVTPR